MNERFKIKKTALFLNGDDLEMIITPNIEVKVVDRNGNSTVTVEMPNGMTETFSASWFLNNFNQVTA